MKSIIAFVASLFVFGGYISIFLFGGLLIAGAFGGAWQHWDIWSMTIFIGCLMLIGFASGYGWNRNEHIS